MMSLTPEKQFECDLCQQIFVCQLYLNSHKKRKHKYVNCIKCKLIFASQIELDDHLKNKCWECKCCLKKFHNETSKNDHLCQPIVCKICNKKFSRPHSLNLHNKIHVSEQPTKVKDRNPNSLLPNHKIMQKKDKSPPCDVCCKRFFNTTILRKHLVIKHNYVTCLKCKLILSPEELEDHLNNKCWECEWCLKKFKDKKANVDHVCHPIVCKFCHKKFSCPSYLKKHIIIIHFDKQPMELKDPHSPPPEEADYEIIQNKEKLFQCDVCFKRYPYRQTLKKHLIREHNFVTCSKCRCICSSKEELEDHLTNKCWECNWCCKKFKNPKANEDHVCQPKVCKFCGKKFYYHSFLKTHIVTHDNEQRTKVKYNEPDFPESEKTDHEVMQNKNKNFQCGVCYQSFVRRNILRKHLVIKHNYVTCLKCKLILSPEELEDHLNNKCWECEWCLKKFKDKKANVDHVCHPIVCKFCGKMLHCPSNLKRHILIHVNEKPLKAKDHDPCSVRPRKTDDEIMQNEERLFQCDVCHHRFMYQQKLKKHLIRKHNFVTCSKCRCICSSKEELEDHLTNKCWECKWCCKKFKNPKANEDHVCQPIVCKFCGKKLPCPSNLQRHILIHVNEKRFKVKDHDPRSVRPGKTDHEIISIKEKLFQCDVCYQSFVRRTTLKIHLIIKHNYVTCLKCKLILPPEELEDHLNNKCWECEWCLKKFKDKKANEDHVCQPIVCKFCGKKLPCPSNLKIHILIHVNEQPLKVKDHDSDSLKLSKSNHEIMQYEEKPNHCNICGESFTLQKTLKKHLCSKHNYVACETCECNCTSQEELDEHRNNKCWECEWCLQKFHNETSKNDHLCQPIVCKICHKKFSCPFYLKKHIVIHTNQKLIVCKICWKRFPRSADLKRHIVTHRLKNHTEKSFECGICLQRFRLKRILDLHRKTVHANQRYRYSVTKCHNCGVSYRSHWHTSRHARVCGTKCKYCPQTGFQDIYMLSVHEKTCPNRKHFDCEYCDESLEGKENYMDHVRKICPKRDFNFKCSCCYSKAFDTGDKLKVLEHVIQCRAKADQKTWKCFICNQMVKSRILSFHLQHELLSSRLFKKSELTSKCKYCTMSYPNDKVLELHVKMDHKCNYAMEKKTNVYPEDLSDLTMDAEKMEALIKKRKENRAWEENFCKNQAAPYHCYICHLALNGAVVLDMHVPQCILDYGVVPGADVMKECSELTLFRKRKVPKSQTNVTPALALELWESISGDMKDRPWKLQENLYFRELEQFHKIGFGCIKDMLPIVIRRYEAKEKIPSTFAAFQLPMEGEEEDDECVITDVISKKDKPVPLVDLSRNGRKKIINMTCQKCRTVCKTLKELEQHNEPCIFYFKMKLKQSTRKKSAKVDKKEKKVVYSFPVYGRYDEASIWADRFGCIPPMYCPLCHIPLSGPVLLSMHLPQCKLDHSVSHLKVSPEDADQMKQLVRGILLSDTYSKEVKENVGSQVYWVELERQFDIPSSRIKQWHLSKYTTDHTEQEYMDRLLARYDRGNKRKAEEPLQKGKNKKRKAAKRL